MIKYDVQPLKFIMASFPPNGSRKIRKPEIQFSKEKQCISTCNLFNLPDQLKT